jgi:effector-binding domain-containing protein
MVIASATAQTAADPTPWSTHQTDVATGATPQTTPPLVIPSFGSPPALQIAAEVRPVAPFSYVCRECTGPYAGYRTAQAAFFGELRQAKIQPAGPQLTLYWNSPVCTPPELLRWEIGFPVPSGTWGSGQLIVKRFTYPKVAATIHRGSYGSTHRTIHSLHVWIEAQGLKAAGGPCVERYLDADLAGVPEGARQTEIWIPVE